jgi:hypothetical protein
MLFGMLVLTAASLAGCRRAIVIVPQPTRSYTARDTLYGRYKDKDVRVTFHFDTLWRTDTVQRTDTLWREGTRTIVRTDTLRRVDTVRVAAATPVPVPVPVSQAPVRPTRTGARVDTVTIVRRDTIRVGARDTLRLVVRDTLRIVVRDTLRITTRDTIVRVDTLRVPGRRVLFVPPGQYPPEGQCRVWIHDLAPGRQADAAPCDALGRVPSGAFILFRGDAWDFDYDWVSESTRGAVPPEIIALQRRRRP